VRTLNPAPGAPRPELIATPAPPTERSQAPQIPCKARLRPANHATTKAVLDGCSADGATRAQSLISPPETAQAPQKTLRGVYSKSEINDLSNLAFISATANKKEDVPFVVELRDGGPGVMVRR